MAAARPIVSTIQADGLTVTAQCHCRRPIILRPGDTVWRHQTGDRVTCPTD